MNKKDIEKLLDDYTSNVMEIESVEAKKAQLIDDNTPQEIKDMISEVNAEFEPILEGLRANNEKLKLVIREQVIRYGQSVKNDLFTAVYSRPRVTWDTKVLKKMAEHMPEVKWAMREGNPSVSIRRAK